MFGYLWFGIVGIYAKMFAVAFQSEILLILLCCSITLLLLVHFHTARIVYSELFRAVNARFRGIQRQASAFNISPVNVHLRSSLQDLLQWNNYDMLPEAVLLENNGKAVVMRIVYGDECKPYISAPCFNGCYYLDEIAFKWGRERCEHSIESNNFSMEIQVLHHNNAAIGTAPEYITVSYLYSLALHNRQLEQVVENLRSIKLAGSCIELPPFDVGSLLRPFNNNYFRYSGIYDNGIIQLPTDWIIYPQAFFISLEQLQHFTQLRSRDGTRIFQNARLYQQQSTVHFINII